MHAVRLIIWIAADNARRAAQAPAAQAAALREAAGQWSILADMILAGAHLPKAWVRQHVLQADMVAARAGNWAPIAHEDQVMALLYPKAS